MVLKLRTKVPPPPGCPMSACMSLLGGVWTPEIIWNLSAGPRRFSELRRNLPAISAKILSSRLKDLQERGVLSRTVIPTTPPTVEYALTPLGEQLIPAIRAIVEVGSKLHVLNTAEPTLCSAPSQPTETRGEGRGRPAPTDQPSASADRARERLYAREVVQA